MTENLWAKDSLQFVSSEEILMDPVGVMPLGVG